MAAPAYNIPMPKERREVVTPLGLGVFLGRPGIHVPKGGMIDCLNVRVREGTTRNENMGWTTFPIGATAVNMDSEQVLLIDQFFTQSGAQTLIFATKKDLFRFDAINNIVKYLTPHYDNSVTTAIAYNGAGPDDSTVTGTAGGGNTDWDVVVLTRQNVEEGDFIHFGDDDYVTQDSTWYEVKEVIDEDTIKVHGDASAEATGDYTVRQLFSGTEFNTWSTAVFFNALPAAEDRWFATNGLDAPVYWNASDVSAVRFDPGFTCKTLRLHKNMLLYGNLLESGSHKPAAIRNSNVANPQDVTTGLASEFTSTDGIDALMELMPIGDMMTAYHERSTNILQFVGLPFVFIIRTAVPGIGPLAPGAITDFGDFHQLLAADAAYEFNGIGIEEIGGHVFHEVLRGMSPDRILRTITHIDEEQGDSHWIVPQMTDQAADEYAGPKLAFTEHYLEEAMLRGEGGFIPMTIRELPATATGYFERSTTLTFDALIVEFQSANFRWNDRWLETTYPFNLIGTEDGYIYVLTDSTDHAVGGGSPTAVNSFAHFRRFPAWDGEKKGLVRRITPYAQERSGARVDLSIKLYEADAAHRNSSVVQTVPFALDYSGNRFAGFRKMMRYAEVEFATNASGAYWEVAGYEVLLQEAAGR
jgi:hypothetical protein